MPTPLWSVAVGFSLLVAQPSTPTVGYLHRKLSPTTHRRHVVPYRPREGDLVFYDDHNRTWTALFALAGTGPPLHMGIVVKKPGGVLAVLEAGPDDSVWVKVLDLRPRLRQFRRDFHGTITIRRCKVRLSRQQSAALTRFAMAQEGKRYAALRLLAQGTPLRVRGPLEPLLGQTHMDRDAWICSELAVAAGTVVGLFDPKVVRSNATYPRDLIDNRRFDLRAAWDDPAQWQPLRAPLRRPHPRSAR
jgi:hypothetical protein